MSNAVYYVEYKLKKGASVQEFLSASEKLNAGHISKQKGYISWKQLYDEKSGIWADFCTFETMEDVKTFEANSGANPCELAKKFYSFINLNSCKGHFFTVERSY
jgi:hypothetical protein